MKRILFIVIASIITNSIVAQQDLTIYYMDNVPQRAYQNPAFSPNAKWHLGLPMISSLYFNHLNTTITPSNLLNDDFTAVALNEFKEKIKDNNYLGVNTRVDFLSFGFRLKKKNYISFNITQNAFGRFNLPGGLLRFPIEGNIDANGNGQDISLKNFEYNVSSYTEFGLGFQREWNNKLNVGGKIKYLRGQANVYTKKSNFQIVTDPQTYDLTVTGGLDIRTSVPGLEFEINDSNGITTVDGNDPSTGDFIGRNHGLGFDFGAEYKLTDKINLNASVIDLGFIRWKNYANRLTVEDAQVVFSGIDYTEAIYAPDSVRQDSIDAATERALNELQDGLDGNVEKKAYTAPLLTRLHFGGTYQVYKTDKSGGKVGALLQTEIYHNRIRPSFTLSYNQSVGRWLNASLSYSAINRSWQNLGAGLSLNLGALQLYMVADNLLAANLTEFKDNGETVAIYPTSAKYVHVHTGLNLTFRGKKDRDGDGIADKRDECPDTPGLKEFNGCPDTDGDGIPDKDDSCPDVPGVKELNGCPDADGDGITDASDECPDVAGLKVFNGCPDTDGDSIVDALDSCVDVAGLAEFNGCPDTDKDGIMDKEDACPNEFGPKENNGCPWGDKDEDGIKDNVDKCPEEKGVAENDGCPWGDKDGDGIKDNVDKCPDVAGIPEKDGCPNDDNDNDGILNDVDKCPNVPGVIENDGCPEIKQEEKEVIKRAFDNLEFETGKAIIKPSSYQSLMELADLLKEHDDWKLSIAGHTDNVGSEVSNMKLSKERALAVKKFLVNKWVKEENIRAAWFGETVPLAPNDTPEGRQKNRRVELSIQFE